MSDRSVVDDITRDRLSNRARFACALGWRDPRGIACKPGSTLRIDTKAPPDYLD
ncbi:MULTISPECIES: hypothetical protein [unclassified Microcoleus]|uniref:hypothetical protein n=1 Tax=unclassified Microcoleus TaxID=2642155 RepID=UPI002FD14D58